MISECLQIIRGTDLVVFVLISFPQMSITSPMPHHGWVRILKSRQITSFAKIDQRVYFANETNEILVQIISKK